MNLLV